MVYSPSCHSNPILGFSSVKEMKQDNKSGFEFMMVIMYKIALYMKNIIKYDIIYKYKYVR